MRLSGAWLLVALIVLPGGLAGCLGGPEDAHVKVYILRPTNTGAFGFTQINASAQFILFKNESGLGVVELARPGPYNLMDPRLLVYEGPLQPGKYVAVRISFENGTGLLRDGSQVEVRFSANRLSNNFELELAAGDSKQLEITSRLNQLADGSFVII